MKTFNEFKLNTYGEEILCEVDWEDDSWVEFKAVLPIIGVLLANGCWMALGLDMLDNPAP